MRRVRRPRRARPTASHSASSSPPVTVEYADITGGRSGPGNFSVNPLFNDPTGADNVAGRVDDDLRLHWASLCINAGNAALLPEDIMDLDADGDLGEPLPLDRDGGTRVAGPTVDMGVYEEQPP